MYKTVFKACFDYLTSFEDLDGFSSRNKEFCEPRLNEEDMVVV